MKKILEKLFLFLLPALFTFPLFKENISSILLIATGLNTFLYAVLTKNYQNISGKVIFLTIPFWIILLFSLIYYDSSHFGNSLNHGLLFLFFPIVFSLIPKTYFTAEKLNLYFSILKISCLIIAGGFVILFLMKYDYKDFFVYKYDIPKFRDFVYNEITFFKIHPTYYTSIVVFIIAFSMDKILSEKKYSELLYILPLTFITFMVLSKLNIIFLGLLLIYMLIFRNNFSFRTKVVSVSTLFIVIITLALTVPGIKHRFREIYTSYNNPPKGLAYDSTNIRIALIKCNLEVAKENFITGIGFSDILNTLHECQSSNYDAGFYKNKKYLTHNYFFYILITTGIFGLLAFIYYCFIVVRKSIAINRFLLYVMLVNVFLVCLTEDFFYRHYGLFYFSLILMTFIGWYQQNNTTVNKKAL